MLFTSLHFVVFLILAFFIFHLTARRFRPWVMLAASIYFYSSWSFYYLGLIFGQIALDWASGQILSKNKNENQRKLVLFGSISINLSILFGFKYYSFASENLGLLGISIPHIELILPLAISFYTFESMSYTIDVYLGKIKPLKSPLHLAVFVTWFPHLIAGPIIRPSHLFKQIRLPSRLTYDNFFTGLTLMGVGFAKKLLFSDWLAVIVDPVFANPSSFTSLEVLIAIYAYAFQIYFDFSGYTDIARGASRLFGIELPINFNLPYLSASLTEFWQRWHITLSQWLRDYLFMPLVLWLPAGGNLFPNASIYAALFITMVLGGLWHGASWTFVVWGVFHGALLVLERAIGIATTTQDKPKGLILILRIIITFHLVCISYILFRSASFETVAEIFESLDKSSWYFTTDNLSSSLLTILLIGTYWCFRPFVAKFANYSPGKNRFNQMYYIFGYSAFVLLLTFLGTKTHAFIYFQF